MPRKYYQKIQSLIELIANVTDSYTSALFLVDDTKNDRLILTTYQSLSRSIIPNAVVPIGHGLVGWTAKFGKETIADNFTNNTTTLQFYSSDEGVKSFAALPIFDGERLLGVLSVDSKTEYVFSEKKIKLLEQFTTILASVILTGIRRIELETDAVNVAALGEIAEMVGRCKDLSEFLHEIRRLTQPLIPHESMALAIRSPSSEEFQLVQFHSNRDGKIVQEPLPLSHYRIGWVIRQARALCVPNLTSSAIPGDDERWRSFISAPIYSKMEVTGAIAFLDSKPGGFRQLDLKVVNILASLCSSTITELYNDNNRKSDIGRDPVTETSSCTELVTRIPTIEDKGAVAVVDLKMFGKVNMGLGLVGGDTVLWELATRLKNVIGDNGEVSRFGGAKFIIVILGFGKDQTIALLNKTMQMIEDEPFNYKGTDVYITPVIGVSTSPEDGIDTEKLLYNAYGSMQLAKKSAGAQLRIHGDDNQQLYGELRSLK